MQWLWIFSPYLILSSLSGLGYGNIYVFYGDRGVDEFPDAELPFTRPISKLGIEGAIVKADPLDACSNISGPPITNNSLNWFVLISGNLCDYGTKIFYSENAGFSAVIIYSLKGSEEVLYAYDHRRARPNISAVVIRTSSGLMIREKYLYTFNEKYRISIFQNNTVSVMTFLVLFAIVIGVFVAIAVIFMIIKYVRQAHTRRSDRLSSRHLNQLQISRYQRGCPYETCAICLEDYKERDRLRILPCLHGYHVKCIDPWLTNNRRICPVCKQKIAFDGESTDNDLDFDTEIRSERTPLLRSSNERQHGTFLADSSLFEPVHNDLTQGAAAEAETQRVPQSFAEIPEMDLSRLAAIGSLSDLESNERQHATFLVDSSLFEPVHNDLIQDAAAEAETQRIPQ